MPWWLVGREQRPQQGDRDGRAALGGDTCVAPPARLPGMMHQGHKVDAGADVDSDWDEPPAAGPDALAEDDQWLYWGVGEQRQEPEVLVDEDEESSETQNVSIALEEMFTDHLTSATSFLTHSLQRTLSMSGNLNPTSFIEGTVQHTRARASIIIGGTVQQTKALSNQLIGATVSKALRLSSGAINVASTAASTATTVALEAANGAATALSPPRVDHITGRVKTLPDALADKVARNSPDLQKLVLRANEVRIRMHSPPRLTPFIGSTRAFPATWPATPAAASQATTPSARCISTAGTWMTRACATLLTAPR